MFAFADSLSETEKLPIYFTVNYLKIDKDFGTLQKYRIKLLGKISKQELYFNFAKDTVKIGLTYQSSLFKI